MGYRIEYEGTIPIRQAPSCTRLRLRSLMAGFFLVFCIGVRLLWPEGTRLLQSYFLPGDLTVTEAAFSEMISDIRTGNDIGSSVTAFCQRIIDETS